MPRFVVVVLVVEGRRGRLSLQSWEGCLDAPTVLPTRQASWERGALVAYGKSSLCEQITFVCQAFTSAYRENLTRFEDLLRLWLKTSPMMPFARV